MCAVSSSYSLSLFNYILPLSYYSIIFHTHVILFPLLPFSSFIFCLTSSPLFFMFHYSFLLSFLHPFPPWLSVSELCNEYFVKRCIFPFAGPYRLLSSPLRPMHNIAPDLTLQPAQKILYYRILLIYSFDNFSRGSLPKEDKERRGVEVQMM